MQSLSEQDTVVDDGLSLPDAICVALNQGVFRAKKTRKLANGATTLVIKPAPHGINDQLEVHKHGRKANVYEVHH